MESNSKTERQVLVPHIEIQRKIIQTISEQKELIPLFPLWGSFEDSFTFTKDIKNQVLRCVFFMPETIEGFLYIKGKVFFSNNDNESGKSFIIKVGKFIKENSTPTSSTKTILFECSSFKIGTAVFYKNGWQLFDDFWVKCESRHN